MKDEKQEREKRLAARLRDNLQRRKTQGRERAAEQSDSNAKTSKRPEVTDDADKA